MKLKIKSAKPLKGNSDSKTKELKFAYSRKKEMNRLYIAGGLFALFVILFFLKIVPVEDNLFYCIFFFNGSFIGLQWFELGKKVSFVLTENQISINDCDITWSEIASIEIVEFDSDKDDRGGIRIIAPDFEDVIIVNYQIDDLDFEKGDLPGLVYMFWKRGLKIKPESDKNLDS